MRRTFGTAVSIRQRAVLGALATLFILGLLLLALAADGMLALRATAAEARVTGERHTVTGSHVAIYNLVGEVRVEAGTGRSVEVWITPGGPDSDELRVETGEIRGTQTLRVVYPGQRVIYRAFGRGSSTSLRVDEDGTFGDRSTGREIFGGARKVTITGSGSGLEAHAGLRIAMPRGQQLDVYLGAGKASVTNVSGTLKVDVASASISATGTRGRLTLDTGSGSIALDDAHGDVSLDTGSGSVDVTNVKGGTLHVDTGSGSISGDDFDVDVLNMDTGSGSIELSGVRAPTVVLDTGSGSVRLGLLADVEELVIDTGSGDVTVYVPGDLGAELSAETGSGGIDTDLPIRITRHSRDSMRGRLGDGRGRMMLETGSGSIRLASSEGRRN